MLLTNFQANISRIEDIGRTFHVQTILLQSLENNWYTCMYMYMYACYQMLLTVHHQWENYTDISIYYTSYQPHLRKDITICLYCLFICLFGHFSTVNNQTYVLYDEFDTSIEKNQNKSYILAAGTHLYKHPQSQRFWITNIDWTKCNYMN